MCSARNDNNSTLRRCKYQIKKTINEEKMAQVIDDKMHFDPLYLARLVQHNTSVTYQNIDHISLRSRRFRTCHDRREIR